MGTLSAKFGNVLGQKSCKPRRKTAVASRSGLVRGLRLEPLEQRQLLSVNIPILNGNFESPTWVFNGSSWVQQAVAPGTQALNYNELDPRFGPPGFAKTAEAGGGPGPNGEGLYNERNDLGYNQYFNYANGHLPAPASGTNFFCLQPATSGGTYHFMVDQQPNTAVDAGNHGDINYPPMIAATAAKVGHTYQVTAALGNPLINAGNSKFAEVELDFTIRAGTYYEPSNTNSYNYTTGQTVSPQPGDTSLNYQGYGTTVATAWAHGNSDPNWQIAPGTFKDLSLTWTCPPEDDGLPLDIQFLYSGVTMTTCIDNIRLVDITTPPAAPTGLTAAGASTSQINLNWTDNSNNESGFKIDQSTSPNFSTGVTTATVGPNVNYYAATGLSSNTTYYFRVRSSNDAGDSANTPTVSAATGVAGTPVAIPVPDGNFSSDVPGYYVDSNSGGGTFTSPLTGTLSGWTIAATPSTANSGGYSLAPVAGVDSVNSGGASPWANNASWLGNQPASSYNSFIYYPGEQYAWNNVVGGVQPGAGVTVTSTGINAAAVAGATYTATIQYGNVSWSNCSANPSANVALNILANGVVVNSNHLSGLAQGSPWTTVTSGWVCPAAYAGQAIQIQVVATNFLEGPAQWDVPTIAFANATLTATTPGNTPAAPSGLRATATSASQINLSWTNNANNQTGFKIDQATSADFSTGLTTVTVGASVTTYSATNLTADTTYYYRVRATNAIGDSANTSTASATTLGATAVPSLISRLQSGQNLNIYAIGTSLTCDQPGSPVYNYGPPYGGPNNSWFDQSVQWLNALGYAGKVTGYDEAQSGAWSTSVAPYPTGGFNTLGQPSQLNWTLNTSAPPDAVFIEFAINDCFTGQVASGVYGTGVSAQNSKDNLQTMINQINAWGASHSKAISIFVMTMNNAVNVNGNTVGSDRANLATYYQGYRDIAAANPGVTLIDNYPNWVNLFNTNPTQWYQDVPDGLHPNGYGSQYVILPTVENAILNQATQGTAPAAPSGLTATATSASQINLNWTDNSNNEAGFKIDQATSSDFSTGLTTVTVAANVTTYSATGLSGSTTYYFRVRATNANGDSTSTSTASARPATALTILNPTFDDGGWLCGDGDDRNAEHQSSPYPALSQDGWWGIYSNTGGVQPWWGRWNPTDAQFPGTTDTLNFPNITRGPLPAPATGTQYAFVTPITDGGTGPLATVWSVNTERFCVKNPDSSTATVTAGQHYVASMAVGRPLDTSCPDYTLELVTEDTTTGDILQVLSSSTVTQANVPLGGFYDLSTAYDAPTSGGPIGGMLALNIICSNFYETNGVGTVGVFNNARLTVAAPVATPTAPSGLTATANSASQINLSWTDNSNNETGFKIDQATSSDFSTGLTTVTVAANATTYSATGLASGTKYYYRVRATNSSGDSANTSTASATTAATGVPVAVPVPDGDFTDAAAYCINSNTGGGLTFTSPMTATLAGWNVIATPSTANGGFYSGWEPYGAVDNVTSGSGASPFANNAPWIGNQPSSSYQAFMYYPGEQYDWNNVVSGAQPGAKLTLTTTGISAAAVSGTTYTATIEYANVSWGNCAANPSANVALNILANGVVVGTGNLSGLAQNTPWTTVTATWTATQTYVGQPIQLQVVATNFLEGSGSSQQWQVPSIAFTHATLTTTAQIGIPTPPSGLTAAAASTSRIDLSWANNANNQTGFKIDQATSSDFSTGLTTVTVAANVTTYSATGLASGTTYYYRVRATNSSGDSANTSTASATTAATGVPVAVPVPDGDFTDAATYCINSNTGGGLTFTSPMTATLAGWNVSATPSTANGGFYSGWEPYGAVDNVTSGSGASPFANNAPWIGNQPSSSYQAFMYYPGEQYDWNNVVSGAQPGAKLTLTTTGISAAAVSGTTYTATIEYANVSWGNCAANPSANVALNILANGVVVGTGNLSGLAQNTPWTTVTATWAATQTYVGQPIQLQVVATNFLEGSGSNQQWQVPSIAFTHATLTTTVNPIASVAAWTSAVDGHWNFGANWTDTQGIGAPGFSGVSGDQASFNGAAGLKVDLGNFSPSIAGLTFGPSALNHDIKSTGSGVLQLTNGTSNAIISVSAGSQTIEAPVVLKNGVNVTVAGGASLTISGAIGQSGGGHGLTLTGGGSLVLSGSNGYSGGTTIVAGTLIATTSTALPSGGSLEVGADAHSLFGTSQAVAVVVPLSAGKGADIPTSTASAPVADDAPMVATTATLSGGASDAVFNSYRPPLDRIVTPRGNAQSARPWALLVAIESFWNSPDQNKTTNCTVAALDKVLARYGV